MYKPFKWKCVILDDQLFSARSTEGAMLGMQIDTVAGPTEQFCRVAAIGSELAPDLLEADLVFIDMVWNLEGRNGSVAARKGLKQVRPGSIESFRAWCNSHSSESIFDTSNRGDEQVGYTLGAAISRLNPHASLVFVTAGTQAEWQPLVSTLQSFCPAPYRIEEKNPLITTEVARSVVATLLRELLAKNGEFRNWLISHVVLPVAVNRIPLAGKCSEIWPDRPSPAGQEWLLEPENVLLPVKEDDTWDLRTLIGLLPRARWSVPLADLRALQALQHDLGSLLETPEEIAKTAVRLRAKCASAGVRGLRLLAPLMAVIKLPTKEGIKEVLKLAKEAGRNDLAFLELFCGEHGGTFDVDPSLARPFEFAPPIAKEAEALPFDLFHLQLAVDALRHNLERLQRERGGEPPRSEVSAFRARQMITVTYVDNSPGFESLAKLADSLMGSLKKDDALDRGLPLALAFPFSYPFAGLEYLSPDGKWHPLGPPPSPVERATEGEGADASARFSFGVRWSFQMDVPPDVQK